MLNYQKNNSRRKKFSWLCINYWCHDNKVNKLPPLFVSLLQWAHYYKWSIETKFSNRICKHVVKLLDSKGNFHKYFECYSLQSIKQVFFFEYLQFMDMHNHMHESPIMTYRNHKSKLKKAFDDALTLSESMIERLNNM